MKDMVRRLQELRHTEQVQRAYALNCGEGATVSYEIQIRVLREFGLADAAAELLQVGHNTEVGKGSLGTLVRSPEEPSAAALSSCLFFCCCWCL
jgi:hypothetical protein